MSDPPTTLTLDDGVATVTLNRPERRNALSAALTASLREDLAEIAEGDARCVVVEGAGEAFSAGGDVDEMRERFESEESIDQQVRRLERTTSETIARLATFPLPTIAEIDGVAFGAGANLAIACDVQLASADAALGFGFRQVGLTIDAGTSYLLPRLVGENVAKELVFTGELVPADRALDLGLVNHVYPAEEFEERAEEFVERVATGPTVALRHAKRLVGEGLDKPIDRAMTDEATAQGIVFGTDDHAEGVQAFLEDREPEFEGQ